MRITPGLPPAYHGIADAFAITKRFVEICEKQHRPGFGTADSRKSIGYLPTSFVKYIPAANIFTLRKPCTAATKQVIEMCIRRSFIPEITIINPFFRISRRYSERVYMRR